MTFQSMNVLTSSQGVEWMYVMLYSAEFEFSDHRQMKHHHNPIDNAMVAYRLFIIFSNVSNRLEIPNK